MLLHELQLFARAFGGLEPARTRSDRRLCTSLPASWPHVVSVKLAAVGGGRAEALAREVMAGVGHEQGRNKEGGRLGLTRWASTSLWTIMPQTPVHTNVPFSPAPSLQKAILF